MTAMPNKYPCQDLRMTKANTKLVENLDAAQPTAVPNFQSPQTKKLYCHKFKLHQQV